MATDYELSSFIRTHLPNTDEIVTDYLAGYILDPSTPPNDALPLARAFLDSFAPSRTAPELETVLAHLEEILTERAASEASSSSGEMRRLDKVMSMRQGSAMSRTLALGAAGVDLESINKSKASRVDVKKLEKQEAKLRAKIEKRERGRRDLYEGSKLLDAQKKQQSYEEMFLKVCAPLMLVLSFAEVRA